LEEVWRAIPGFDGYEASNLGRIRSLKKNNILYKIPRLLDRGYCVVDIMRNLVKEQKRVHCLIMLAFVGPKPEGYWTNHKDGNKQNNCIDNLEYTTPQDNVKHAFRTGLNKCIGENNHNHKLTAKDVKEIRLKYTDGYLQSTLAQEYGVGPDQISRIVNYKVWRHVDSMDCYV